MIGKAALAFVALAAQAAVPLPLTEDDIPDRRYTIIADIEVSARKATLFSKDPTRADIDRKLRDRAAKLGADAVILVRYGSTGVAVTSWGVLEGRGRAVRFD